MHGRGFSTFNGEHHISEGMALRMSRASLVGAYKELIMCRGGQGTDSCVCFTSRSRTCMREMAIVRTWRTGFAYRTLHYIVLRASTACQLASGPLPRRAGPTWQKSEGVCWLVIGCLLPYADPFGFMKKCNQYEKERKKKVYTHKGLVPVRQPVQAAFLKPQRRQHMFALVVLAVSQ